MAEPSRILVRNLACQYEKRIQRHVTPTSVTEHHANRIKSKYNQLVSSIGQLDEILSLLHENQKLTNEELDEIRDSSSSPAVAPPPSAAAAAVNAKETMLNVVMKKPRDVYECFLVALEATGQYHVVQMLTSEVDMDQSDSAMHVGLISRRYKWLTQNLNPDDELVLAMYRNDVLTRREREQLDSEKNGLRRNEQLLAFICRKSSDEFQRFLKALEDTRQTEAVNRLNEANENKECLAADGDGHVPATATEMRTRIVTKPLPLSSKPALPPRPKSTVAVVDSSKPPPRSSSSSSRPLQPTAVVSPKRRSISDLERQLLSQPKSPVPADISLKIASLRQNTTDVEDEILKKKAQDSLQLKKSEAEADVERNSREKMTGKVIRAGKTIVEATTRMTTTMTTMTTTTSEIQRVSLMRGKSSNEKNSTGTEAKQSPAKEDMEKRKDGEEEKEMERLKKEYEEKLKKQLEESTSRLAEEREWQMEEFRKLRDELSEVRDELEKERKNRSRREMELDEMESKLREVEKEMVEAEKEKRMMEEDLEKEKWRRMKAEKLIEDAEDKILELRKEMDEKEERGRGGGGGVGGKEIEKEKMETVRQMQEKELEEKQKQQDYHLLSETMEKVEELRKQLEETEKEVDCEKKRNERMKNVQEQLNEKREEQEKMLMEKIREMSEQLREDERRRKKEKSTDCDSALIPLRCVHG